jgi:hypothetical protein
MRKEQTMSDTPRTDAIAHCGYSEAGIRLRLLDLCRELERERAGLREELDDWHNAALHVKANHPDEVHCGCVPILRRENARLQEEIERLSQSGTERMGGIE